MLIFIGENWTEMLKIDFLTRKNISVLETGVEYFQNL
jgi:hypothetical protein